jgi:DNA-binding NtrC family response regulator
MSERVLLVDPDPALLAQVKAAIEAKTEYAVLAASDPREVAGLLSRSQCDLLICALAMPGFSGLELLDNVKAQDPDLPVVLITAYPTVESAVAAMKQGAFDFLEKPVHEEQLLLTVERALQWRRRVQGQAGEDGDEFTLVPGINRAMQEIQRQTRLVADTMATVLITGESGTGKELVARALHLRGSRGRSAKLVVANCAAIPEDMMESELFGQVKGAFAGAVRDKQGLVAEAEGGTLFLDEIGDLSRGVQAKLLRLLQEGEYRPLGSEQVRKADVRFIAASSQNLDLQVAQGSFREDLYFRLNVIRLEIPPLRKRPEDIPVLARYFLEKYARRYGVRNMEIGPGTLALLQNRPWPGNVRELENVIKRAVLLSQGLRLNAKDIFPADQGVYASPADEEVWAKPFREAKERMLEDFTQRYVQKLLGRHQGNVSRAAEASGIKRQYLHKLMRQSGIKAAVFKKQI